MTENEKQNNDKDKGDRFFELLKKEYKNPANGMVILLLALSTIVIFMYIAYSGGRPALVQRSLFLMLVLPMAFLGASKIKGKTDFSITWVLAAATFIIGLYHIFTYDTRVSMYGASLPNDFWIGILFTLLVIEITRRSMGWALPILAIIFIAFAYYGPYMPGILQHRGVDFSEITRYLFTTTEGIYGIAVGVAANEIVVLLIFAAVLVWAGGADFFINFANALFGRYRGGAAKVAVVGSSLMGTLSGTATANVAGTGAITIPLMKKTGYKSHFAGAVEAVSSSGGQIMPPVMGSAAFVMAEIVGVSYIQIMLYALIPAILYYFAAFIAVDLEAARLNLKGLPAKELPKIWGVLKKGWPLALSPIVLVILLGVVGYSVTHAAFYSVLVAIITGLIGKETRANMLSAQGIMEGLKTFVNSVAIVGVAVAAADIVIAMINVTGLGLNLSSVLISLASGSLLLLLILTMVASIILGMGLPTVAAYIMLALLVGPALIDLGVMPGAAHMFVFYYGILSAITPPVAIAAFVASGIAGSEPMKTAITAVRIALPAFFLPFMFIYHPALIMKGSAIEVIYGLATTMLGIFALTVASEGFFLNRTNWIERIVGLLSAILLIWSSIPTDIIGFVLFIVLLITQFIKKRQKKLVDEEVTAG